MKNQKPKTPPAARLARGGKNQKLCGRGVSLVITIMVLSVLMVVSFGASALLLREIKLSRETENATLAYFAADTGIERILWDIREGTPPCAILEGEQCYLNIPLFNGAVFSVEIGETTPTSPPVQVIDSNGTYQGTNRAVSISYEVF